MGHYNQVINAIHHCDIWENPKFIDRIDFVKIDFEPIVSNAILEKNKQWLSENISYPIMVSINGKSRTTIRNKKELLQNFDVIFHAGFIEKAKAFECIDIFCNYKGLMLGAGEIWMNCVSTVNNDQCQLKITAINN